MYARTPSNNAGPPLPATTPISSSAPSCHLTRSKLMLQQHNSIRWNAEGDAIYNMYFFNVGNRRGVDWRVWESICEGDFSDRCILCGRTIEKHQDQEPAPFTYNSGSSSIANNNHTSTTTTTSNIISPHYGSGGVYQSHYSSDDNIYRRPASSSSAPRLPLTTTGQLGSTTTTTSHQNNNNSDNDGVGAYSDRGGSPFNRATAVTGTVTTDTTNNNIVNNWGEDRDDGILYCGVKSRGCRGAGSASLHPQLLL